MQLANLILHSFCLAPVPSVEFVNIHFLPLFSELGVVTENFFKDSYFHITHTVTSLSLKCVPVALVKGPWQSSHPGDEADFYTLYCTQPVLIKNLSFLGSLEMENQKINPKSHLV